MRQSFTYSKIYQSNNDSQEYVLPT